MNNRWVQLLIAAIIIIGICMVAKLDLKGSIGSHGMSGSIDRGK